MQGLQGCCRTGSDPVDRVRTYEVCLLRVILLMSTVCCCLLLLLSAAVVHCYLPQGTVFIRWARRFPLLAFKSARHLVYVAIPSILVLYTAIPMVFLSSSHLALWSTCTADSIKTYKPGKNVHIYTRHATWERRSKTVRVKLPESDRKNR